MVTSVGISTMTFGIINISASVNSVTSHIMFSMHQVF
jgi:hypothetical protein